MLQFFIFKHTYIKVDSVAEVELIALNDIVIGELDHLAARVDRSIQLVVGRLEYGLVVPAEHVRLKAIVKVKDVEAFLVLRIYVHFKLVIYLNILRTHQFVCN